MPIIKTNQFWDYLINEPVGIVLKAKELLKRKYYNFDNQNYDIQYFYQHVSRLIIDSCQYDTLRFPGGLSPWLANNLGVGIENKQYTEKEWDEEEIREIAKHVTEINPSFEIRDYQIEAVQTSLNQFRSLINASVGSGKSSIMSLVCKCLLQDNKKILILNGNNLILGQIAERLESFGITDISWKEGEEPDFTKSIVIMNISNSDSHLNRQDEKYINYLKNDVKTICYDECFSGDTEILTSKGWKQFKNLTGQEQFANFKAETKEIYFTPGKLLKKVPTSDCLDWKLNRKAHVILTAKHQQLYYNTKTNKLKKDEIQNISFINKNNKIFCSGKGIGKKEHLSILDKILIAIQADGCAVQKADRHCYHIGFKKERKIEYWQDLIKDFSGKIVQLKSQFRKGYETKRWHIWLPEYSNAKAKKLYECFNLSDFSYTAAKEFIEEIIKWDGWKQSKNVFGYISIDKQNTDFVSAVACLAGYETYQQHGIDKRDRNTQDWHRVFLRKTNIKSIQNCTKNIIENINTVYCVEVPEHNIVVRNGGLNQYTFISGNCHHLQSLTAFEPIFYTNPDNLKHIIGYSGSPFRNRKDPYKGAEDFRTIAIIGEPAFNYEMKDAIADGNIAQPYGYFIRYQNKECFVPKGFEKNYYMQYRANITYNKARNKAGLEMLKFLNKNNIKTFASLNNTKVAQNKMKELRQKGIKSLLICGNNTLFEWIDGPRGGLKLEKRKGSKAEVIEALNNGYNIILGTSVLDEGVSIDIFQAAVLFSAGRTNIAGVQRLGRASRKRLNGQNVSFVIDFQDTNGYYIFEEHYKERRQIMLDSGIKILDNVLDFINFIQNVNK